MQHLEVDCSLFSMCWWRSPEGTLRGLIAHLVLYFVLSLCRRDLKMRGAYSSGFTVTLIRLKFSYSLNTCWQCLSAGKASWVLFVLCWALAPLLLLLVGGTIKRSSGWGNCESSILQVVCLLLLSGYQLSQYVLTSSFLLSAMLII